MNDFGVAFIRQARHQKLRIVEFVLKKLKTSYLSERDFEEKSIVIFHMIQQQQFLRSDFPNYHFIGLTKNKLNIALSIV
jgi:hypothetical protein